MTAKTGTAKLKAMYNQMYNRGVTPMENYNRLIRLRNVKVERGERLSYGRQYNNTVHNH